MWYNDKCCNVIAGNTTPIKCKTHLSATLYYKMKWPAPLFLICAWPVLFFTFWVNLFLHLQNTDGLVLLQCAGPQGHVCQNEAALYTNATSHVMHIPLKEGGQHLQSTDHLFKQPFVSPTPGSWQQLAARTGHSSPGCQSVHYGVRLRL